MKILIFILRLVLIVLQSVAIAYGAILLSACIWNWYHGGTPDPRCVLGWRGYIEHHHYDAHGESVTCEYRPERYK